MALRNRVKASAYNKKYHQEHKAERAEKSRQWYADNPNYNKEYRAKNKEQRDQADRDYRASHQEELKRYFKKYYQDHKDKKDKQGLVWRRANPDKIRAYLRTFRAKNPDVAITLCNRHRARKRNAAVVDLSPAQWREIQAAQQHRCYYCGKRCKGKMTQEHITPSSKGGSYTLHNIVGACQSCNSKKSDNAPPIPVQPLLLTIAPAKKPRT